MDLGMFITVALQVPYFICDPLVSMLAFFELVSLVFLAKYMNRLDAGDASPFGGEIMNFWIALNVLGWIAQFVGHGVFEKRAPAILTNIMFFWIAGFFQVFDILNKVYEYRAEEKKELDLIV